MSDITSYIDWKKKREIINTEGLGTLKDDTVKGVLRSIGDAGDSPVNATGETVLSRLKGINDNLSTRASEATLSNIDSKFDIQLSSLQRPDLFPKEIDVGTTAVQVDTNEDYRAEVILLADDNNTANVLVGNNTLQAFPLKPGAAVGIMGTALNKIYLKAVSGTQKVYVLTGGS